MLKRILDLLGDSLAYGVSGLLGQLIGFLLLPLYSRLLTPSDYGVLAMLAFLPQMFTLLAASGVKSAVYKQFYKIPSDAHRRIVLSTAAVSVLLSCSVILLVSLLSAKLIARWLVGDESAMDLVRLSLVSAAITTLVDIPLVGLQAVRKAKTVGLLNICQLLAIVSATIYLVAWLRWGVLGVVVGSLVGSIFSALICFGTTARSFALGIDWRIWREMAAYSLPFLPHRLQATAMIFFGEYMIRTHLGLEEVGLYNVAARFALPIGFLFGAIQQAWIPYKFKVFAEDPNPGTFFRSTLTYFMFVLTYLWLGISLWGPEALRLMTPAVFHPAAALVWALALMRSAQAFAPMTATGIELGKDTRTVPLTSLASLITMIIAGVTLVPMFGAFGAAFATTLAWLAMAAGFFIIGQRHVRVHYDWVSVGGLCATAAAFVIAGQCVQSLELWIRLIVMALLSIAYPCGAWLILLRSPTERHRMEILASRLLRG
jgi:O-antigen/teichoic acid export membrane protein